MRLSSYLNNIFTAAVLLVLTTPAFSQCFVADDLIGCPPHTINVTNCGPVGKPVFYDYGDGSGISFSNTHTYSMVGSYTVTQYAGTGANIDTLEKVGYINVLDNPEPQFTLFNCSNKTIQLTIDEDIYDEYEVDYGDGTSETLVGLQTITKTYSDLINKTITVTGKYLSAPCTNQSSKTTFLYDALIPATITQVKVIAENATNGQVTIDFDKETFLEYRIKQRIQGTTTFEILDTIFSASTKGSYTINNLNTLTNSYEYVVETFDRCGLTATSNLEHSLTLTLSASTTSIDLNWNNYTGTLDHFEVIRNSTNIPNGTTSSYTDVDLVCKKNYCYQVIAYKATSSPISFSPVKCIDSPLDTDPQPITGLNVTVENEQITLFWDTPNSVKSYSWTRSVNGSTAINLGNFITNQPIKKDASASVTKENCYQLNYRDECNNVPVSSASACNLSAVMNASSGNNISISWTDYSYFSSGLSGYYVQYLDENNQLIETFDLGTSTSFTGTIPDNINGTLKIRVLAKANDGTTVKSNILSKSFFAEIHFPTAFTPNGDGLNDTFFPKGLYIKDYDLYIYTRQGELVFHSSSIDNGWDGILPNGKKATEGVYSYVAEVTGAIGNKFTKKGTFTLLN